MPECDDKSGDKTHKKPFEKFCETTEVKIFLFKTRGIYCARTVHIAGLKNIANYTSSVPE